MAGFCIMYMAINAREEDWLIVKEEEEFLDGYALEANLEGRMLLFLL